MEENSEILASVIDEGRCFSFTETEIGNNLVNQLSYIKVYFPTFPEVSRRKCSVESGPIYC